jgi:hypothetical protein
MPLSLGGALWMTEVVTGNPIRFMGAGSAISVGPCVGFGTREPVFFGLRIF